MSSSCSTCIRWGGLELSWVTHLFVAHDVDPHQDSVGRTYHSPDLFLLGRIQYHCGPGFVNGAQVGRRRFIQGCLLGLAIMRFFTIFSFFHGDLSSFFSATMDRPGTVRLQNEEHDEPFCSHDGVLHAQRTPAEGKAAPTGAEVPTLTCVYSPRSSERVRLTVFV